jgi:hypothetical protein
MRGNNQEQMGWGERQEWCNKRQRWWQTKYGRGATGGSTTRGGGIGRKAAAETATVSAAAAVTAAVAVS